MDQPGKSGRVAGKTVLVTGAASGLGRQIALRLWEEGATVVLADRDAEGLARLAPSIPGTAVSLDVTSEEDWAATAAQLADSLDRLDGLVNCAGIAVPGDTIAACSLATFDKVMQVNVTGTFLACRAVLPLMRGGTGSIVNIGSMRSHVASADTLAYTTSKTAILGLTRSAAIWCAENRTGIRVNAICPGTIRTEMHKAWMANSPDPAEAERAMAAEYPVGHLGEPDDVAWLAVYLISDESRFTTGAHLTVDGGYTAR